MVVVNNSYKDDRNKRMMRTGTRTTLSQARLREIVREVATQRAGWRSLVRYDPAQRWYQLLQQHDDHEIWLLSWLPGQSTGFHDHGWSAGAFTVAEGCLAERGARRGRPRRRSPPARPVGDLLAAARRRLRRLGPAEAYQAWRPRVTAA
jgi:hypothetical protein